jgi:hypothetical protein
VVGFAKNGRPIKFPTKNKHHRNDENCFNFFKWTSNIVDDLNNRNNENINLNANSNNLNKNKNTESKNEKNTNGFGGSLNSNNNHNKKSNKQNSNNKKGNNKLLNSNNEMSVNPTTGHRVRHHHHRHSANQNNNNNKQNNVVATNSSSSLISNNNSNNERHRKPLNSPNPKLDEVPEYYHPLRHVKSSNINMGEEKYNVHPTNNYAPYPPHTKRSNYRTKLATQSLPHNYQQQNQQNHNVGNTYTKLLNSKQNKFADGKKKKFMSTSSTTDNY